MSSSVIITIAVPAVVLLILVIMVVAVAIYILRRCRFKQHNIEMGKDYNSKKRLAFKYLICHMVLYLSTYKCSDK